MVNQVNSFLDEKQILTNYNNIKTNFNNYSATTRNRYLGMMIFGMALHLAGDMYAHRTIVPKYTVQGVNGTENSTNSNGQDMFGTKYFNKANSSFVDTNAMWNEIRTVCFKDDISESEYNLQYWEYMQRGVSLQVVEFRDINMFLKSNYQGNNNPFEDKANFCSERYEASLLACKRIAQRFKNAGSFYVKLIYPKYYDENQSSWNLKFQTVKLNNFRGYANASGLATIGVNLTEDDWAINSNTTLV